MSLKALVSQGPVRGKILYPGPSDRCTESNYALCKRYGKLVLKVYSVSPRRLRRFLRDLVRHEGGLIESLTWWLEERK
jgi:hypothetical protein